MVKGLGLHRLRIVSGLASLLFLMPRLASGEVKITRDVVYGVIKVEPPTDTTRAANDTNGKKLETEVKLKLDVYEPDNVADKRPGIVVVHGGGWFSGDKGDPFYTSQCKILAEKGYVACSVNYRLAPTFHYPAQVDDVQRAVRWIRAHADTYHIDPDRLGGFGDWRAGISVSLLGTRDTRDNSDTELASYSSRVQCVVDLFGPSDFTASTDTLKFPAIAASLVTEFMGKKRDEAPELYKEGSPVTYVDKKSAPFLIMHGDLDPLVPVDQSKRLQEALEKAGVEATLIVMPKDYHGFRVEANKEKQKSAMLEFFARHLKP